MLCLIRGIVHIPARRNTPLAHSSAFPPMATTRAFRAAVVSTSAELSASFGLDGCHIAEPGVPEVPRSGQRQQPKRQSKSQRKGAAAPGSRSSSAVTPQDDPEGGPGSGAPQAG